MILSYKLYINILLEPVKVDIKRTQSCVVVQTSQADVEIIFQFMNNQRLRGVFLWYCFIKKVLYKKE